MFILGQTLGLGIQYHWVPFDGKKYCWIWELSGFALDIVGMHSDGSILYPV